jgi:hypothetical protein
VWQLLLFFCFFIAFVETLVVCDAKKIYEQMSGRRRRREGEFILTRQMALLFNS